MAAAFLGLRFIHRCSIKDPLGQGAKVTGGILMRDKYENSYLYGIMIYLLAVSWMTSRLS